MPAEVDAVVAEPARDRDVLRGELDEEGPPSSGLGRVALDEREQLVADDDAGDRPAVEGAGRGTGEQVHVREHREVEALAPDPADELVVLARVPADLLDHEAGTGLRLLAELEVLRHHLALVPLVVRDDAAEEEVRASQPRARPALVAASPSFISENRLRRPTESMSNTGAARPRCPTSG